MSRRPAAYAMCIEDGRVLLALQVPLTGGELRPQPGDEVAESAWTPLPEVALLRRSSLVDIGIALALAVPPTGHVTPVAVGGPIQH
ncbi:hypothetical protein E1212_19750 [Jiangella ureilytica]|uniref:NUDIX hydrolase n=1 Tax=Jiangella ureilytica TaxID=2530374 RepID=A0A4R4RJ52_9ACTN|nr:hypothetical protein [Jiangella ureilytica]TDC48959.1 hypothetical protein E1212_19750 [Jiangella ureilytica]